jgi:hypothetical protein
MATTPTPQVETFECPYQKCIWPRCKTNMTDCINHPLCGSEIEATKMRIVQRYEIKPRPKLRRRKS